MFEKIAEYSFKGCIVIILLALVAGLTYSIYEAATDPCKCLNTECRTTIITMPDSDGIPIAIPVTTCTCTEKYCPPEKPE